MVEDLVPAVPLRCSITMAKVAAARVVEESSQEASSDEEELEIDGVVAGTNGDATSAEEEAEPGSEDEADEGSDAEAKPKAKAKAKGRQKVLGAKAGSGGKAKPERNTKDLKFSSGYGKSHDKKLPGWVGKVFPGSPWDPQLESARQKSAEDRMV